MNNQYDPTFIHGIAIVIYLFVLVALMHTKKPLRWMFLSAIAYIIIEMRFL